jgi:TRAP-type mannitol/chloroaromatic compound transport system substrate-binding protein
MAAKDPLVRKVFDSQQAFLATVSRWHDISEVAYYRARELE